MKLNLTLDLPYPPAVVMRALIAPQFHLDKARALGAAECELLEEGRTGTRHFVRIRRRVRQSPVPGPIAKLVPEHIVLTHRDEWDEAAAAGRLEVDIAQVPIQMSATVRVEAAKTGSQQHFEWNIHSSLPLVGRALEKMIAQDLTRTIRDEGKVVAMLLEAYADARQVGSGGAGSTRQVR